MIVGIEGTIELKQPTLLHINTNGLIHEVFVSTNCSSNINANKVKLFTTQIIREDLQALYGFIDHDEKKLFDKVIKINGVGPKVALAICSTFTPSRFASAINTKDINMLKSIPGIGPKSASRLLVELSGFVVTSDDKVSNHHNEAFLALESLGFKKDIITRTLQSCQSVQTSDIIKEALKKLQK